MKLIDKQIVEATSPTIHVGRRTYRDKRTRQERVNGPYWAEYFTHGRQYQESLKTSNKAVALRRAYALAERLERGQQSVRDSRRTIQELSDAYKFCPDDLFAYRTFLAQPCGLSEKSVYHETIVIKQLFKWAAKDGYVSRNLLAPMFATLAFTGMRIGELKQLTWEDVDLDHRVIHVHRGGSGGKPKDKEDRFLPVHARKLGPILRTLPRASEQVLLMPDGKVICEKKPRAYLKNLCRQCGFPNPQQYKLHTFRHFFASYGAQQNLSYKYVLEWMGHSSSAILDMYFTMNDRHAQAAMNSLSFDSEHGQSRTVVGQSGDHSAQTLAQVSHV